VGLKFLTGFQEEPSHHDDDIDNFYACAWSCDSEFKPLLAAAGQRAIIRVFDLASGKVSKNFVGHTHAINDLRFHSRDTNLLFSASKDHSVRLWNIKTDILIAIFHGEMGHRDEAISLDIDLTGMRLLTSGMDHAIKVWKLDDFHVESAVKLSYVYNKHAVKPFPTFRQQFPDFTSRSIHGNYVDCVRWFGDLIVSKACSVEEEDNNDVVIWKAGKFSQTWDDIGGSSKDTESQAIARLKIDKCRCWFMRFALTSQCQVLALGNEVGETYVYDLTVKNPKKIQKFVLSHPKCTKAIRQTAFSRDGQVLICVCDDGTIWRWDRTV
jgi:polycomb protein EED